jgi:hypothetical protein
LQADVTQVPATTPQLIFQSPMVAQNSAGAQFRGRTSSRGGFRHVFSGGTARFTCVAKSNRRGCSGELVSTALAAPRIRSGRKITMATIDSKLVVGGVESLLREVLFGPAAGAAWVLNSGDKGVLETLESISASDASRPLIPNRSSIAGHAGHLRYSLSLLNRWANGENPFVDADWPGSWKDQEVDQTAWEGILRGLREEATSWLAAATEPREWDPISLTGAMASAVHIGYHLGAIRQLMGHLGR